MLNQIVNWSFLLKISSVCMVKNWCNWQNNKKMTHVMTCVPYVDVQRLVFNGKNGWNFYQKDQFTFWPNVQRLIYPFLSVTKYNLTYNIRASIILLPL